MAVILHPILTFALACTFALVQCNEPELTRPPATIPQDPAVELGGSYQTPYNVVADLFRRFPSITNISQIDWQHFGEKLDFESIQGGVLIGAADKLYLLNSDLEVTSELEWTPLQDRKDACENEYDDDPLERNYVCRNHIRLYQRHPTEPDLLYVCGTQAAADTQQCRGVAIDSSSPRINTQSITSPIGGSLGDPYDPRDSNAQIISPHPDFPSFGDFRQLNSTDSNYISWTYRIARNSRYRFNEQQVAFDNGSQSFNNTKVFGIRQTWFDPMVYFLDMVPATFLSVDFTPSVPESPDRNYKYYFLFLREVHRLMLEQSADTEPLILSQVVRICRDDPGVLLTDNTTEAFSTLLKARMYCDQAVPSDNPLEAVDARYNDLWSVALTLGGRSYPTQPYNRLMYGAFSTILTGPAGSAICAYIVTPSDGEENNNRGLFDTFTEDINVRNADTANENIYPHCDGNGRPAFGSNSNRVTAEDTVVSRSMLQLGDNPIIVLDSIYLTQMVVDEVCVVRRRDGSTCINQDVIFAGTSEGKILKITLVQEGDLQTSPTIPLVAEEISLDNGNHIKELRIEVLGGEQHLYAVTSSHVYKLSLERCSRHEGLQACVASRDPYCVWNSTGKGICQRTNLYALKAEEGMVPPNILQNITSGYISNLAGVGFEMPNDTVNEGDGFLSIAIISNYTVPDGWVELKVINKDGSVSDPYPISFDNITASVSIPVPSDSVYNGVENFRVMLSNTLQGRVFFTREEANVSVIDDDGIIAQIGLSGLDATCLPWRSRYRVLNPPLKAVDEAILKGLNRRDLTITSAGIFCSNSQALLNAAIYRFTLTATTGDIDISQLKAALRDWVGMETEVKLEDGATVKVDSSCNTRISSPNDNFCTFNQVFPGGVQGAQGVESPGGTAAVVFGILFAIMVVVCTVLVVVLMLIWRQRKSIDLGDSEIAMNGEKPGNPEHTYEEPEAQQTLAQTITNPGTGTEEQKKDLTASHASSHASDSSHDSPVSPTQMNSAAPLMRDGVQSRDSPFHFPLHNPP